MKNVIPFILFLICLPTFAQAGFVLSQVQEVSPRQLMEVNGTIYFSAHDNANGYALWKSDGTRNGTKVVKTFDTGGDYNIPTGLFNADGTLFFCAYETASSWELWKSNGTESGTTMVTELYPGPDDGVSEHYCQLALLDGKIFFGGNDATHGAALWKTDGTAANTVMVYDLQPSTEWGIPEYPFVMGNTLYFVGNDGDTGDEWWKCEGPDYNSATTSMVKDIWTAYRTGGVNIDSTRIPVVMDRYFYFQGHDGLNGYELWRSNGTALGTEMVKDIDSTPYVNGVSGSSYPRSFTLVGETLFFSADDAVNGRELWKSDGTEVGTVLVKDINDSGNSSPDDLAAVGTSLYFSADDGTNGVEPWKSDGTTSGTVMIKDINASGDSYACYFTAFGNEVYFSANDGINGTELWRTSGTAGNASLVSNIASGSDSSWPNGFLVFNDGLFFRATYDNSIPEGEGDALFRYGELIQSFYWPMFLPAIMGK
ncbi:MAG: hypothetical protein FP810_04030 [Desulfocapsa sp.]|jgi:ELWxxDGT repeat protein|nr:hypothetical protein [Desulfocapsa sp.]